MTSAKSFSPLFVLSEDHDDMMNKVKNDHVMVYHPFPGKAINVYTLFYSFTTLSSSSSNSLDNYWLVSSYVCFFCTLKLLGWIFLISAYCLYHQLKVSSWNLCSGAELLLLTELTEGNARGNHDCVPDWLRLVRVCLFLVSLGCLIVMAKREIARKFARFVSVFHTGSA